MRPFLLSGERRSERDDQILRQRRRLDHGVSLPQAVASCSLDLDSVSGQYAVNPPADIGSVQAVVVDAQTGKQYGGADARREGTVIGLPRPGPKK